MNLKSIVFYLVIATIIVIELGVLLVGWAFKFITLSFLDWSGPLRIGGILCLSHLIFFAAFVLLVGFIKRSPIYLRWLNKAALVALALGFTIAASYVTFELYPGREEKPNDSQVLAQLGIDEERFAALPPCDQVRIYAYVSPYFSRWHGEPFADPWMTETLLKNGKKIAPCVIPEAREHWGKAEADTTEGAAERVKVRALHILLRKLQDDYLSYGGHRGADLSSPEAQSYMDEVVCHASRGWIDPNVVGAFYMSRFRIIPMSVGIDPYLSEEREKLKNMLCK